jgi:endonuclease YncB( thermonuclease family)
MESRAFDRFAGVSWICMLTLLFYQQALVLPAAAETFSGKVVAVSDGDTITVLYGRVGKKVRLDGIDAPERKQDYGTRARQFVGSKVFGKTVQIDFKGTDRYGRLIGLVVLPDKTILNHEIVRNGLAWWYRKYAPDDHLLERLEADACSARRGLWQQANPTPPWEFRRSLGAHQDAPVMPLPSGELPILGNRNSRIYHRPNCDSYSKISPKSRVVFEDESAANRAGYRLARNCN